MKKLFLALALALAASGAFGALHVEWDFDARYLDTLIYWNDEHRRWDPVPGPYEVRNGKYYIPIVADQPSRLYRVARVDGTPQVITPP